MKRQAEDGGDFSNGGDGAQLPDFEEAGEEEGLADTVPEVAPLVTMPPEAGKGAGGAKTKWRKGPPCPRCRNEGPCHGPTGPDPNGPQARTPMKIGLC